MSGEQRPQPEEPLEPPAGEPADGTAAGETAGSSPVEGAAAAGPDDDAAAGTAEDRPAGAAEPAAEGETGERAADEEGGDEEDGPEQQAPAPAPRRRRRDPLAAALIGVLTLLLGFAFAVQVRSTDSDQLLAGAREEDLVRILDDLTAQEDRLRQQIAEQRALLEQLGSSDSRSAAALEEARQRAEAIGILNGTIAAQGPGVRMVIRDPEGEVRVADLLDAIQELRGAGAETMQIDDVRIGVSTAVTGEPGQLRIDGQEITAPYEVLAIGSPPDLETAMNIPGGVVQRIGGRGGTVEITQSPLVVVDALRPLDTPEYASPESDGG
ncbi:DUF881 domain-containing protein [Geodermatophilus sp. SYSU D00815]